MATKAKKPAAKKAVTVAKAAPVAPVKFTGRVNDAVRVKYGELDGAIGKVQAINGGGSAVLVLVQGIHNSRPVDSLETYHPTWLEVV
jgi:transcription antitermination factor NusG